VSLDEEVVSVAVEDSPVLFVDDGAFDVPPVFEGRQDPKTVAAETNRMARALNFIITTFVKVYYVSEQKTSLIILSFFPR
jgi:hypothetical protein